MYCYLLSQGLIRGLAEAVQSGRPGAAPSVSCEHNWGTVLRSKMVVLSKDWLYNNFISLFLKSLVRASLTT